MDWNWASLALERRGLLDESKALSMTVRGKSPKVAKQIQIPKALSSPATLCTPH